MAYTDRPDEIEAFLTEQARANLARALNGQAVVRVVGFSTGRGGFDPSDPVKIIPVNAADLSLMDQTFPDVTGFAPFESIEEPTPAARVHNCRLAANQNPTNADYAIGEIGLWAEILNSDIPSEIGTVFLYAIAHLPIRVKTNRDVVLFRVVVNY